MAAFGMVIQIAHGPNGRQPTKNFGARNWTRIGRETKHLKELGWDVLVVWTCEVNDVFKLKNELLLFLES